MTSPKKQKDLFDDSVMTFGEHLEILRVHLIRALLGLMVAMVVTLTYGESVVGFIRKPIDHALDNYSSIMKQKGMEVADVNVKGFNFWAVIGDWFQRQIYGTSSVPTGTEAAPNDDKTLQRVVTMEFSAYELARQLHELSPKMYPEPTDELKEKPIRIDAQSEDFGTLRTAMQRMSRPITLDVTEAFFTYFKVSLISGLIFSSPWILYQAWLFVAAGLYPHERKYVYIYLPFSIILFLGGAGFCYYAVFPTVLDFLIGFNIRMQLTPQIRISEYINFAVMFPLMFGLSFQLPLVMLFLQKISIFDVAAYREKRRLAILAIAFVAMLLTPTPDPFSMLMMMFPLMALYELGIWLCIWTASKDDELATA